MSSSCYRCFLHDQVFWCIEKSRILEPQDIKYLIITLECKYGLDILNLFTQISSVCLGTHQLIWF